MTRILLAILLLLYGVPSWGVDTVAPHPAALADAYPAAPPVAGAPVDPAVKAGLDQAAKTIAAVEPWYKGAGGVALGIAASLVLSLLGVARHSSTVVPQPWGAILSLVANGLYAVFAPKIEQVRDKQLEHHEDTVYTMAQVIEALGNNATIGDLKAKLATRLPSGARDALNQVVAEVRSDLVARPAVVGNSG